MSQLLAVQSLSISQSGPLLSGRSVSFELHQGETIALIGPSGIGKSTMLSALFTPSLRNSGTVSNSGAAKRFMCGYMPQDISAESSILSVLDIVSFAASRTGAVPSRAAQQQAMQLLIDLDMGHIAHRRLIELSGGQQQRAMLARAIMAAEKPQILLLDEPTANVDPATKKLIYSQMSTLNQSGYGIIVSTHDLDFALQQAHVVVALSTNRVDVIRHEELESSGFLDIMFAEGL